MNVRELVSGGGGVVVGLMLGLLFQREDTGPAVAPRHPRVEVVESTQVFTRTADCPPASEPDCTDAIARALTEHGLRRSLLISGQVPVPWPDDLPRVYSEAEVRPELYALLERYPAFLEAGVDCREFPCIALLELPDFSVEDDLGEAREQLGRLVDEVSRRFPGVENRQSIRCGAEAGCTSILQFGPASLVTDDMSERLRERFSALEAGEIR
jgi:hypothetical protein